MLQILADTNISDAVVVWTETNHPVYECINLLPDSARIYPISRTHSAINNDDLPEKFLIWLSIDESYGHKLFTDELDRIGYQYAFLGHTHASKIYIATKIQQ